MRNLARTFFRSVTNRRGVSLTEVMLAVGIMTIAGFGVAKLSGMVNQNSTQLKATRVAVTARAQIEAALKNPTAWAQTVNKNVSFKCATQPPGCPADTTYDFVLYGSQPNEKVSFDATDPTTKYSLQGGPCPAGSVGSACPIKYQAQWRPVCQSYPCLNPSLEIKVQLTTEFSNQNFPFNTGNYSYATVRGINEDTIQSACLILNGTYNSISRTCYPKYAGKNCADLGKVKQIVTGVHADGSIDCAPLYSGQCDPATQMMTGIDSKGKAICAAKVQPPTCPKNCVGGFGKCNADCGGGKQFYAMTSPATFGGKPCPFPDGASQDCNLQACPIDCVGEWSDCSVACGGGNRTYTISTDAANGGKLCPAGNGESSRCNTQACAVPVDCGGNWSACDPQSGTQTFSITQVPQDGGAACPASPRACRVDCVGDWGACSGGAKTYTWSIAPKNGGAACTYPNGLADAQNCSANGVCGRALGGFTASSPSSSLCSEGTPSAVSGGSRGPWSWTCNGSGGGSSAACSSEYCGASFSMTCGSQGCNVAAWNKYVDFINRMAAGGKNIGTVLSEASNWAQPPNYGGASCSNPFTRGSTYNGASGDLTYRFSMRGTEDMYTEPYRRTRASCSITYVVNCR